MTSSSGCIGDRSTGSIVKMPAVMMLALYGQMLSSFWSLASDFKVMSTPHIKCTFLATGSTSVALNRF